MAAKKSATLRIRYIKSAIGRPSSQKKVVAGLGLRRLNQVVERPDSPQIRGMVEKVPHLVEIVDEE